MFIQYDHIHIACSNLNEAVNFYVKVLDAKIHKDQSAAGQGTIDLDLGGILLRLSDIYEAEDPVKLARLPKARAGGPHFGLHHLGFTLDSVRRMAEIKSRGAVFVVEPYQYQAGSWAAVLLGPDNVRVELKAKIK